MATSSSSKAAIYEEIQCAICLSDLKSPRALVCLHSFCEKCLKKVYATEHQTRLKIRCPLCQEETQVPDGDVAKLRLDFRAARLIEAVDEERRKEKATTQTVCDVCGHTDSARGTHIHCLECEQIICEQCAIVHGKMRSSQNHTVTMVTTVSDKTLEGCDSDDCTQDTRNMCLRHKGIELDMFCITCLVPVCHECTFIRHSQKNKHDCKWLEEFLPTMKQELQSRLTKASQRAEEFDIVLDHVDTMETSMATQREILKERVKTAVRERQTKIDQWEQDLYRTVDDYSHGPQEELKKLRQNAERGKASTKTSETQARDLLNGNTDHIKLASSYKAAVEMIDQSLLETAELLHFLIID